MESIMCSIRRGRIASSRNFGTKLHDVCAGHYYQATSKDHTLFLLDQGRGSRQPCYETHSKTFQALCSQAHDGKRGQNARDR